MSISEDWMDARSPWVCFKFLNLKGLFSCVLVFSLAFSVLVGEGGIGASTS